MEWTWDQYRRWDAGSLPCLGQTPPIPQIGEIAEQLHANPALQAATPIVVGRFDHVVACFAPTLGRSADGTGRNEWQVDVGWCVIAQPADCDDWFCGALFGAIEGELGSAYASATLSRVEVDAQKLVAPALDVLERLAEAPRVMPFLGGEEPASWTPEQRLRAGQELCRAVRLALALDRLPNRPIRVAAAAGGSLATDAWYGIADLVIDARCAGLGDGWLADSRVIIEVPGFSVARLARRLERGRSEGVTTLASARRAARFERMRGSSLRPDDVGAIRFSATLFKPWSDEGADAARSDLAEFRGALSDALEECRGPRLWKHTRDRTVTLFASAVGVLECELSPLALEDATRAVEWLDGLGDGLRLALAKCLDGGERSRILPEDLDQWDPPDLTRYAVDDPDSFLRRWKAAAPGRRRALAEHVVSLANSDLARVPLPILRAGIAEARTLSEPLLSLLKAWPISEELPEVIPLALSAEWWLEQSIWWLPRCTKSDATRWVEHCVDRCRKSATARVSPRALRTLLSHAGPHRGELQHLWEESDDQAIQAENLKRFFSGERGRAAANLPRSPNPALLDIARSATAELLDPSGFRDDLQRSWAFVAYRAQRGKAPTPDEIRRSLIGSRCFTDSRWTRELLGWMGAPGLNQLLLDLWLCTDGSPLEDVPVPPSIRSLEDEAVRSALLPAESAGTEWGVHARRVLQRRADAVILRKLLSAPLDGMRELCACEPRARQRVLDALRLKDPAVLDRWVRRLAAQLTELRAVEQKRILGCLPRTLERSVKAAALKVGARR